jgi:uncharacterized alkaline shock family protein YloU
VADIASISSVVLARYAADAAMEAPGVRLLVGRAPVRITEADGVVAVEIRIELEWGASLAAVGGDVQERVRDYLGRMADLAPRSVDVVVESVGPGT